MDLLQLQARGVTRIEFNDRRSVESMLIPVTGHGGSKDRYRERCGCLVPWCIVMVDGRAMMRREVQNPGVKLGI